jgi:hypothetical protein
MVEYYMLPDDIKPGRINKALSKLEINDEYKTKREHYDTVYATIVELFKAHRDVNAELGEKRIPIYAAAALKMMDIDADKAMTFISAFFNPLENDLPKGNAVDAMRQELVETFATGQRDKTRPIFIRRAMLLAFEEFFHGRLRTKWGHFIGAAMPKTGNIAAAATALGKAASPETKNITTTAAKEPVAA